MPALRKVKRHYYGSFYDPTRQPKRKNVALRTTRKEVAEARLRQYELQYAQGMFDPWNPVENKPALTYDEAGQEFLKDRRHLRPKTLTAYREALCGLGRYLPPNLPLQATKTANVRKYIEDLNVSKATRRHRYRHLRTFFNWAIEHGHLEQSPLKGIRLPKQEQRVAEFLSTQELERKEGYARDGEIRWLINLILLAVNTGLRLGELCHLRWSAIDLVNGFLSVKNTSDFRTKSGNERRVPLVGDALRVIQRLQEKRTDDLDGPVLTYANGRPLVPSYASKRFKKYVRLARLPEHIRFHSLRHTCASWLVMRGVSLPIVQAILGHSSIQVTERYAHLAPDVVKAAMQEAFDAPASPSIRR